MRSKLTAHEVLARYVEEDLPEFNGISLTDVNQKGLNGGTPLSVAATRGAVEEVPRPEEPLLILDEQRALPGEHGVTHLHDAVGQGHFEVAKLLIQNGARTDMAADFGGTPRQWAERAGFSKIAALLSGKK